jgi:GntR family transcriptional regulator/MocR family aminotransferase
VVTLDGDGALHAQLYRGLRRAIVGGRFPPRTRLPSTRALAQELALSRNIVLLAFDQLQAEGYVDATIGSGTYVAAVLPDAAFTPEHANGHHARSSPGVRLSAHAQRLVDLQPLPPLGSHPNRRELRYDFRYGIPSLSDFPQAVWARLVARRARGMTLRTLRYGMARGFEPLREQIVAYLRRARGIVADLEQVIVVNGTQQAIDLATRLLIDPGDRVVIEEPSYQAARQVFVGAGAQLVPVPVDDDGLVTDALPTGPARLAYVTPSHQFPLGGVMPRERRIALLRWAERAGAHILEDDYDVEFRYTGRPVEAVFALDRAGCVIHVGTFSKVLFPSLRIGYVVVPKQLARAVAAHKWLMDCHTPTFEQEVLADFIRDGHFERHLRRARQRNLARRQALLDELARAFGDTIVVRGADAGIHVVVELRGMSASELPDLQARAAERGVGIYPVTRYHLHPPAEARLLFGYACLEERQIRAGVRALADVVRSHETC